jgi:hypothetical protein
MTIRTGSNYYYFNGFRFLIVSIGSLAYKKICLIILYHSSLALELEQISTNGYKEKLVAIGWRIVSKEER